MNYDRPVVKFVFPVGEMGLTTLPDIFNIQKILEKQSVILYNPFNTGLSFTREAITNLTFSKLSYAFIVESEMKLEVSPKSRKVRELFNQLSRLSRASFEVIKQTHGKQLYFIPREARKIDLTPDDIHLIPSKPSRKIESPKNKNKPSKPKPGGF